MLEGLLLTYISWGWLEAEWKCQLIKASLPPMSFDSQIYSQTRTE